MYPVGKSYERLGDAIRKGVLSLEDLCRQYSRQVYAQVGSYAESARRLKVDRRTVKKYVTS